ncbi:CopG family transcriptional regulator [Mesorhizobium sp. KR2-14]|uniref:ribbon-helix-helix domain-containing protein n=1 Tax=Mesorhizobium sp. KR2-14 TaxID=3156610 RepID=UPI0032B4CDE4
MKNVTISLDEKLLALTEAEAAKAGVSTSEFIADIVESALTARTTGTGEKNRQLEALERIFAGPMWDVTENGRMPTAEERNARR